MVCFVWKKSFYFFGGVFLFFFKIFLFFCIKSFFHQTNRISIYCSNAVAFFNFPCIVRVGKLSGIHDINARLPSRIVRREMGNGLISLSLRERSDDHHNRSNGDRRTTTAGPRGVLVHHRRRLRTPIWARSILISIMLGYTVYYIRHVHYYKTTTRPFFHTPPLYFPWIKLIRLTCTHRHRHTTVKNKKAFMLC